MAESDDEEVYGLVRDFVRANVLDSELADPNDRAYPSIEAMIEALEGECELTIQENHQKVIYDYCNAARQDMAKFASHINYLYQYHQEQVTWTDTDAGESVELSKSRQLAEQFDENLGAFADNQIEIVRHALSKKLADKILNVSDDIGSEGEGEEDDEPPSASVSGDSDNEDDEDYQDDANDNDEESDDDDEDDEGKSSEEEEEDDEEDSEDEEPEYQAVQDDEEGGDDDDERKKERIRVREEEYEESRKARRTNSDGD